MMTSPMWRTVEKDACHWLLACTQRHTDKHTHMHTLPHIHIHKEHRKEEFHKETSRAHQFTERFSINNMAEGLACISSSSTLHWPQNGTPLFFHAFVELRKTEHLAESQSHSWLVLSWDWSQAYPRVSQCVDSSYISRMYFLDKKIEGQHLQFLGWLWSSGSIGATLSRSCFSNWKKKSWNQKSTPWE